MWCELGAVVVTCSGLERAEGCEVPQFYVQYVVVEVLKGSCGKEIGRFVIQDALFPLGPHKLP